VAAANATEPSRNDRRLTVVAEGEWLVVVMASGLRGWGTNF
jgi:hypothetical protein